MDPFGGGGNLREDTIGSGTSASVGQGRRRVAAVTVATTRGQCPGAPPPWLSWAWTDSWTRGKCEPSFGTKAGSGASAGCN